MVIRNGSPDIDSDEEQFLHAIENQLEPLFIQTCRMVILSGFFLSDVCLNYHISFISKF